MQKYQSFLFIFLCFITFNIFANDSAGTTAAGGIHFVKMPDITMQSEKLTIDPNQVDVKYHFYNHSKQDITTEVLFPLPAYKPLGANEPWDSEISKNTSDAPFTNFAVIVDGKSVKFETIISAKIGDQDVTQKLRDADIPLNPELVAGTVPVDDTGHQIETWQQKAKTLGFLDAQGKPKWQKQIIYEWTQTFPAGKTITIEHRYRPATGAFYAVPTPNQNTEQLLQQNLQRLQSLFHINLSKMHNGDAVNHWLMKQLNPKQKSINSISAFFYNVDYILTTGANWAGSIQHFTLKMMKPKNGVVAYNAFYDSAKVKMNQNNKKIEINIDHFVPQKDLRILFVAPKEQ